MIPVEGLRRKIAPWMLAAGAGGVMIACSMFGSRGPKANQFVVGEDARAELITEAESNYTFGSERTAVPIDTTNVRAPGGVLPTITIATATQTSSSGRVPSNRFVSRLTSSAAFPHLGLAPDVNYIWHDTSSSPEGPWRTLVVPKNLTYPMVWLRRDTRVGSYALGSPSEPRLVKSALGYATCDHNCDPHCASKESERAFATTDSVTVRIK